MNAHSRRLMDEAMSLPAKDKAELVDQLLDSLDRPDSHVDDVWRREVEKRVEALDQGKLETVSLEEVLAKYRK